MSEYQYYEFCSLNTRLSKEARSEMSSLSSRAQITPHGASYVYNYGDFRGKPEALVLKYFDVFFYISNSGTLQLLFKYSMDQVVLNEIKKYCISDVITCRRRGQHVLLGININQEESGGWIEGDKYLLELLPLYEEIKHKDYSFLCLVAAIEEELTGEQTSSLSTLMAKKDLSQAQKAFLKAVSFETTT